jgi:hypothetical protein
MLHANENLWELKAFFGKPFLELRIPAWRVVKVGVQGLTRFVLAENGSIERFFRDVHANKPMNFHSFAVKLLAINLVVERTDAFNRSANLAF